MTREEVDEFRKYIQDKLDELGDDNPFGQSDKAIVMCRVLREVLEKFESLAGSH